MKSRSSDDNDRAARKKRLGGSSSEERQDLQQGLAIGHLRTATGRGARRARCGLHKYGGGAEGHQQQRLHQTCGPVNQHTHVHVEKCPLTMRHAATSTGDSFWRESTLEARANAEHDRIHTEALGESGPKMDGDVSVTNQSSRALERNDLHAQRAERGRVVLGPPDHAQHVKERAKARERACGVEHVGQHVDGRTARRDSLQATSRGKET